MLLAVARRCAAPSAQTTGRRPPSHGPSRRSSTGSPATRSSGSPTALPKIIAERAQVPGLVPGRLHARARRAGRSPTTRATSRPRRSRRSSIDDPTGAVLEQWTGYKVAWTMARGYSGRVRAQGQLAVDLDPAVRAVPRAVRRRWRRPLSAAATSTCSCCSRSASRSPSSTTRRSACRVPLVYPPLLYLLLRMLWSPASARARPVARRCTCNVPSAWLAVGVIFLLGFRIGAERRRTRT